jgi:putative peptidoglycan lipid II flippase
MILPSIVALSVLGKFVVTIIYQTGKFTESDTLFVWYILIGASLGLLPNTWGRLYSSTLYALLDTKTPLKCASVRVLATVFLGVLFAFPLRPLFVQIFFWLGVQIPFNEIQMGAVGLSLSSSLAGIIEYALLKRSLSKRLGNFKCNRAKLMGCLFAAISSSLIALSLALLIPNEIHSLVRALIIMGVFGIIYLGLLKAFRLRA